RLRGGCQAADGRARDVMGLGFVEIGGRRWRSVTDVEFASPRTKVSLEAAAIFVAQETKGAAARRDGRPSDVSLPASVRDIAGRADGRAGIRTRQPACADLVDHF